VDELRQEGDDADAARLAEPQGVLTALAAGDVEKLAAHVHNDMTEAAVSLMPDIARVMDEGRRAGAHAVLLSGSGPTVGFLAQNAKHALELAVLLEASRGVREVVRTTGPAPGAHIVD
jgi:4-diphosphocytidyl-2-C-methyl-D-erythritol kinase